MSPTCRPTQVLRSKQVRNHPKNRKQAQVYKNMQQQTLSQAPVPKQTQNRVPADKQTRLSNQVPSLTE